ncbi:hypothetical protein HYX16_04080 [Candidatus Woesearchaeota archaeon]|nr:hypothetical protein [Candidatus Woesearchaeota archaeon]
MREKPEQRYVGLVRKVSDSTVKVVLRGVNDLAINLEIEIKKIRSNRPIRKYDILVLEVNNGVRTAYIAYPQDDLELKKEEEIVQKDLDKFLEEFGIL